MLKTVNPIRPIILIVMIMATQAYAYGYSDILFSGPGLGNYCAGSTIPLTYQASSITFLPGNVLRVELSDNAGSFASPVPVGTLATQNQTGTIQITLPTTASGPGYRVRVVASAPAFVGSDNGKTLTINQPPLATPTVTIFGPPTVCVGTVVEFTAAATNEGSAPSYSWKKNGVDVGTNSTSYIDNALVTGDAVMCILTSNRQCITNPTTQSNTLNITVTPKTSPTITITADPSTTVGPGSVIYLSSSITNGGSMPTYEWKKNGTTIIGTTNAFATTTLSDNDVITATVTSNESCAQPLVAQSNNIEISIDNNMTKSGHSWEFRASQSEGPNPIIRSNASGFSIGSKAYVGVGYVMTGANITYRKDFWEYDPTTDVWTQRADFAGVGRYNAVGFSIGSMGYIGTGLSATGTRKDFYQYDPTTNTWLARAELPGSPREQAFGMGIGNKGYVGGGYTNGQGDFKDFYEFDPLANTWRVRADFGGGKRRGAAAFSIDSKGFVAGGFSGAPDTWYKDFWEYDAVNNLWTKRADMPGKGRSRATVFAVAGAGYVGLGYSDNGYQGQMFQYNVSTDTWTWKPYYPGPGGTTTGTAMTIGSRSFVYKDGKWVEYSLLTISSFSSKLCSTESVPVVWDAAGFTFGPGNTFKAEISTQANFSSTTLLGQVASTASTGNLTATVPPSVVGGTYYFRIISSNPTLTTLLEQVVITALPSSHIITSESGASVCKDTPAKFTSNLKGDGVQWYRNDNPVGTIATEYNESNLVTGDLIKAVRSYTEGCKEPVGLISNTIKMTVRTPTKPVITITPNTLKSTAAVAYQWYLNDVAIAGATTQSHIMTKPGVYKVRITDNAGCFAFSDDIGNVYVGLDDELDKLQGEQVFVYPNPATDEMTLELADDLVSKGCSYSVVNELGQTVVGTLPAEKINKVNLSGRSSGLYMVRLTLDGATVVRRIVKVE